MSRISIFLIATALTLAFMGGWLAASMSDANGGKHERHDSRAGGSVNSLPLIY